MSNLQIINQNGVLCTDSRDVATMVGKNHSDLLRSIKSYVEVLTESNFAVSDFFLEHTYQDSTGRTLPCYLITRKGCDMVANKMTGEKGVLFTAAYVTRFEEMEKHTKPMCLEDVLISSLQQMKDVRLQVEQQAKAIAETQEQVKQIAATITTSPNEYYTIAGYASLQRIKVDVNKANLLGRKARKLSQDYNVDIGKAHDAKYGTVNTYHLDILKEVFESEV